MLFGCFCLEVLYLVLLLALLGILPTECSALLRHKYSCVFESVRHCGPALVVLLAFVVQIVTLFTRKYAIQSRVLQFEAKHF